MNTKNLEYYNIKRKILFDTFDKFPKASTRMIARILYKDHPEFFLSIENARSYVRVYRGQHGNKLREDIKQRKYFKI